MRGKEEREARGGREKEEKEIRKRKNEERKSKGREKRPISGCLTSADETIHPSECFGKRACGARVGVSRATNK